MKDQKTRERFIELRAAGRSYADIATELTVSKQTLISWSRELQVEIFNLKAIESDALLRRWQLHAEGRLEIFGTMLDRLKAEFLKRDLADLPTDKLLDQITKLSAVLAREPVGSQFWERTVTDFGTIDFDAMKTVQDSRWPT